MTELWGVSEPLRALLAEDFERTRNLIWAIENETPGRVYVDCAQEPTGVLVVKEDFSYLYACQPQFIDQLLKQGFLQAGSTYGFAALTESVSAWVKDRTQILWRSPCSFWYLPPERLDRSLIVHSPRPLRLEDAKWVYAHYTQKENYTAQKVQRDILYRPSSAIFEEGRPVSWVLVHNDGSMGAMETLPDYRGRGYAVDVTVDLSEALIARGQVPFLHIDIDNPMSPPLAQKCGFIQKGQVEWLGVRVPPQGGLR